MSKYKVGDILFDYRDEDNIEILAVSPTTDMEGYINYYVKVWDESEDYFFYNMSEWYIDKYCLSLDV